MRKTSGGMEETSIQGEIKRLELYHLERKWVRVYQVPEEEEAKKPNQETNITPVI